MGMIVILSGSLREHSYNTALAHALAERTPAGCDIEVATPAGIPLYDGDREATEGIPEAVQSLKARIQRADGLILVTPEYNQGVPGVMKNALDWLSRPPADIGPVFGDRAVALCGATPGSGGTRAAQYALLPTLRALGTRVWSGKTLYVASANKLFDDQGRLVDEAMSNRAGAFVDGFCEFIATA